MFSPPLKKAAILSTAAMTGFALISAVPSAAHHHSQAAAEAPAQPNIVETAQSTGVHNTLVAAVVAADLAETLSGPGPITVFAPTDTAFAKLPAGTVETLVKPENKAVLTSVLTYHAVAGNVTAGDLIALIEKHGGSAEITALSGAKLTARLSGTTVIITDAAGRASAVTQADVETSNGIIHVTDGVFLPG
jgi:uncharacterized surface protein with fasciclin (FAS1) repeats